MSGGPDYRAPEWVEQWSSPDPPGSRSGLLAGAMALLVAGLVTTTVLLTQGGGAAGAATPGTQPPPTPISMIEHTTGSTGAETTDRQTTSPAITAEESTEHSGTTGNRSTGERSTSGESSEHRSSTAAETTGRQASGPGSTRAGSSNRDDQLAARKAAEAWARAINNADGGGVVAASCSQDRTAYASGELSNPAEVFAGHSLTVKSVLTARPVGLVRFTIDPAIDHQDDWKALMTRQGGQWLVCVSVSDPDDL